MRAVRLYRGRLRGMVGVAAVAAGLLMAAGPAHGHSTDMHAAQGAPASLRSAAPVADRTSSDELLPADKDLLVKVRLAGLWEMPAGEMAAEKGASARVREVGKKIADQHAELDALVVKAANELDVDLPDEPNADQQRWLAEMDEASGKEFDQIFVDRLRAAHGKVFPVVADVRVGTRNAVVRRLAQRANGYVLTHLTLLESTDLVDYESLPKPKAPAPPPDSGGAGDGAETKEENEENRENREENQEDEAQGVPQSENANSTNTLAERDPEAGTDLSVIWIILATSLIVGAIGTTRLVRPKMDGGGRARSVSRAPGAYYPAYHTGQFERPGVDQDYYDDYSYPRPVPRSRR